MLTENDAFVWSCHAGIIFSIKKLIEQVSNGGASWFLTKLIDK